MRVLITTDWYEPVINGVVIFSYESFQTAKRKRT